MGSLRRTQPENLEELTIQVAIVRPGPIVGGAVNPYIERRQRLNADPDFQVPYLHPSLEQPLKETLGTIIFQDQVLEVAQAFAGFSVGEAEGLRRAMSRKRSEEAIEAHHRELRRRRKGQAPGRQRGACRSRSSRWSSGLLGLRVSQGARRCLRPARLPIDVAARALRSGVPLCAARRAADGLLSARRTRPRGAAARDPRSRVGRQRERGRLHGDEFVPPARPRPARGADRLGLRTRRARRRGRSARLASGARVERSAHSRISPRVPARAGRRSSSSPGRVPATRWPAAIAASRCGSSG